jgi:acetyl-CoA decarbonylase/synthase complex subunit gamma
LIFDFTLEVVMALTGLEIFKLLPKTNCKKCGMPTCLAFAMQLAQKRAKLEDCPHVSEESKQKLAAAAAPPMRKIAFGRKDAQVTVGQETVMFRHEEKFYNPTVLAVTISDKLSGNDLSSRIKAINSLQFERVGTKIGVRAIAVTNDSGSPEPFAQVCAQAAKQSDLALILVTESPQAAGAALKQIKDTAGTPLLAAATTKNAEEMAKIAKENACPLVAKAGSIEELADLSEKIKGVGVEDIVLSLSTAGLKEKLYNMTRMRVLSLKKVFRPLGYPTVSFVLGGSPEQQTAVSCSLICKYSSIVVVGTVEPYAVLPMLTCVMNIFTDPQKPVQVEPKVYAIGEPGENSPLMFTTNFSLTYYTVVSDVEASRVPSYILVVDTEGTSVLTAYSGDKLNEKTVADAMAKDNVASLVKHRKLIIPGYVAVMSGKLEEATNWEVMVGPRESAMLPKYLKEVWK